MRRLSDSPDQGELGACAPKPVLAVACVGPETWGIDAETCRQTPWRPPPLQGQRRRSQCPSAARAPALPARAARAGCRVRKRACSRAASRRRGAPRQTPRRSRKSCLGRKACPGQASRPGRASCPSVPLQEAGRSPLQAPARPRGRSRRRRVRRQQGEVDAPARREASAADREASSSPEARAPREVQARQAAAGATAQKGRPTPQAASHTSGQRAIVASARIELGELH